MRAYRKYFNVSSTENKAKVKVTFSRILSGSGAASAESGSRWRVPERGVRKYRRLHFCIQYPLLKVFEDC